MAHIRHQRRHDPCGPGEDRPGRQRRKAGDPDAPGPAARDLAAPAQQRGDSHHRVRASRSRSRASASSSRRRFDAAGLPPMRRPRPAQGRRPPPRRGRLQRQADPGHPGHKSLAEVERYTRKADQVRWRVRRWTDFRRPTEKLPLRQKPQLRQCVTKRRFDGP
jgi:hypothetical protein